MTLEFFEMQKELFMAPSLKTYAGTTAERVTFAKAGYVSKCILLLPEEDLMLTMSEIWLVNC